MKNEYITIFGAAEAMSDDVLLNRTALIVAADVIEGLQDELARSREREEEAAAEIKRLSCQIDKLGARLPSYLAAEFVRIEFRTNPRFLNSIGERLFDALAANFPGGKLEFIRAVRTSTNWGMLESRRLADFIWG